MATSEQRLVSLEDSVHRMQESLRETGAALSEGKFGQRQGLIEGRQVRLERDIKQVEAQIAAIGEELASRPLKTDVITAIAQQELAVEACAPKDAVERLEQLVANCASQAGLGALEEVVRAAQEQLGHASQGVSELRDTTATKAALAHNSKEIDSLRTRLDEKVGRDEANGLMASKLDKAEARGLLQQQEQLSNQVVGAEAHARRLHDSLSTTTNNALDAAAQVKQLSGRLDRLSSLTHEVDSRLNLRKNELQSLTKVVRLILDDAEMRCAIDEAEGATAAEATDVLHRLRGVSNRGAGPGMTISGVTLHKPPGQRDLTPMPPGAAAADKVSVHTRASPAEHTFPKHLLLTNLLSLPSLTQVWYKSSLQPRSEVLGARRRMLVNARHSWVGEACLARSSDEASHVPGGGGTGEALMQSPRVNAGTTPGYECMLTPSSTGKPEHPA